MKTNKEIIIERFCAVPEIPLSPTDYIDATANDIDEAMKEAQSEAVLCMLNNYCSYPNPIASTSYKIQLALDKTTREINEGKKYSWFEFMGRRHKGL